MLSFHEGIYSELAAFAALGLTVGDMAVSEDTMQDFPLPTGTKTPEGIFDIKKSDNPERVSSILPGCDRVSIEVKRIAFHAIPDTMPHSYKKRYSRSDGWYTDVVQTAVNKITEAFATEFDIHGHVVCVALPERMPEHEEIKILEFIIDNVDTHQCPIPCAIETVRVPNWAFGKLVDWW